MWVFFALLWFFKHHILSITLCFHGKHILFWSTGLVITHPHPVHLIREWDIQSISNVYVFTKLIPWNLNFTVWLSTPDEHWRWKALQIIWFRGRFTGRHLTGNPSREWPTPPMSPCFPWTSLKLEDYEEDNKSGPCMTSQQSCGSGRLQSHRMLELVVVSRPHLQGLRLALVLRGFQKTWQAALGQCYDY